MVVTISARGGGQRALRATVRKGHHVLAALFHTEQGVSSCQPLELSRKAQCCSQLLCQAEYRKAMLCTQHLPGSVPAHSSLPGQMHIPGFRAFCLTLCPQAITLRDLNFLKGHTGRKMGVGEGRHHCG